MPFTLFLLQILYSMDSSNPTYDASPHAVLSPLKLFGN